MKLGRRAAVIAAAGGIVFAGLAGPAYADSGSCTGVVGQEIAHPEYFATGSPYRRCTPALATTRSRR